MLDYWLKYTDLVQIGQVILSGRTPRLRMEFSPFPQIYLFHPKSGYLAIVGIEDFQLKESNVPHHP